MGIPGKCVPIYWELTCRNGDGLDVLRGSTGGRKAGCSIMVYLVPWEWGERVRRGCHRWSATELGTRMGDWEDLKIYSQATCFFDWNGLCVPRECLLELAAGIKWCVRSDGMEVSRGDMWEPLEITWGGLALWRMISKNPQYIKLG